MFSNGKYAGELVAKMDTSDERRLSPLLAKKKTIYEKKEGCDKSCYWTIRGVVHYQSHSMIIIWNKQSSQQKSYIMPIIDTCIVNYIYITIFCYGASLKKNLATWGLEPASPVSVNRHSMLSTIIVCIVILLYIPLYPSKKCI